MKYVIDLDGTLCTSFDSKYKLATAIDKNIEFVNRLHSDGHTIIIFTARGMNTFRGIALLAKLRWRRITTRQLSAWGVKYHKLILGKPSGDYYVDDKGINSSLFFN